MLERSAVLEATLYSIKEAYSSGDVMLAHRLAEGMAGSANPTARRAARDILAVIFNSYFGPISTTKGECKHWMGEKVNHLVLLSNAGRGDLLQVLRFIPEMLRRAERITVIAPDGMVELIEASFPRCTATTTQGLENDLACADAYILTTSLWRVGPTSATSHPYLMPAIAPAQLYGDGLKAGIVWAGNPEHSQDAYRSMQVETLTPLSSLPRVTFHSLQAGGVAPPWMTQHRLDNYLSTAAVVAALDIVVSVDTSVAHLAAAMGKPVLLLLSSEVSDARWSQTERQSLYPTVKAIRQTTPGQWHTVLRPVMDCLSSVVSTVAAKLV